MKLFRQLMLISTLLLFAGGASAIPVTFTFESSTSFDAQFPSTQTFTPALPFSGVGDVNEAAGTYSLNLPNFSIVLDILNDGTLDAELETIGWAQVGTFAGGAGGAMTSSSAEGITTCDNLGGLGGLVCADFPAGVEPWPGTGDAGPTLGPPSATIDIAANTITVNSAFDANGGQIQSVYSYAPLSVPEPGTMLMLGTGLLGLAVSGRRRA